MAAVITPAMERWKVVLSAEDEEECQVRAKKWMEFKGNDANLFDGQLRNKLCGLRAEKAFCRLLEHFGIPFDYGSKDGMPDAWDFRINIPKMRPMVYSLKCQRTFTGVRPTDYVTLNKYQANHPCDFYVFAYNLKDGPEVVFLGEISRERFMKISKAKTKGESVTSAHRYSYVVQSDMLVCRAQRCKTFSFLPVEQKVPDSSCKHG